MPTYLRNFYIKELINTKKQEEEALKKANQKTASTTPSRPGINPRLK